MSAAGECRRIDPRRDLGYNQSTEVTRLHEKSKIGLLKAIGSPRRCRVRATKTISASVLWTSLISVLFIVLYVRNDLMDLLGHPLDFPKVAVSAEVVSCALSCVLSLLPIVVSLRYFGTPSRHRAVAGDCPALLVVPIIWEEQLDG